MRTKNKLPLPPRRSSVSVVRRGRPPKARTPIEALPLSPKRGRKRKAAQPTRRGRPPKLDISPKPRRGRPPKVEAQNGKTRGAMTALIGKLLQRPNGVTRREILDATGWPTVSVQTYAKANGIKLRKYKETGKPTVYLAA